MTTGSLRKAEGEGADRKCRCFVDLGVERCETENNLFELDSDKSCSVSLKQTIDRDTNTASTGTWSEIIRLSSKLTCQSMCAVCVCVCEAAQHRLDQWFIASALKTSQGQAIYYCISLFMFHHIYKNVVTFSGGRSTQILYLKV